MLFNRFQFLIFFVLVWALFLALRGTPRKVLLLLASYYFYMCWNAKYILLILAITLVDYALGLRIEGARTSARKRSYLLVSLACNLGLLGFFKYFNFASRTLGAVGHALGFSADAPLLDLIVPVGLSFHTFQAMSYTIELYRGRVAAERNLLNYALYVAFFPQMVAGPIERPYELLPQFRCEPRIRIEAINAGLAQAGWGLFKKMVIADSLAPFVSGVYADPQRFGGTYLLLATAFFALQIYCDFSGYSDIALGVARVMGYELKVNFRQPYFARSIPEFWHRWHISLSTWFRDYVYIPLGGSRVSRPRHYANLMATFVLSGFWHGANWTFLAWGALHGLYQIASHAGRGPRASLGRALALERFPRACALAQMLTTFALVTLAWVFFRASSIGSAWYIISHFYPLGGFQSETLRVLQLPRGNLPFLAVFVATLVLAEWWIAHPEQRPRLWQHRAVRRACYLACAYSIVFFGVFGHLDFIYFQF